jgi:uncharacterized protein YbjT (DUF2867 family)
MIAVAGATGHTGRAVADTLLKGGTPVRVIVRDEAKGAEWKARGADVAITSLDDAVGLTKALAGAAAAYLLVPPAYGAADLLAVQRQTRDGIVRAVKDSDVGHVVFLSSIGAQHASGTGPVRTLHDVEQALRTTGKPVTILRAPYFMENWAGVLGAVTGQGVLPSFIPVDKPVETASAVDIGRYAASLLTGPVPSGVRIVEFGGPRRFSPRQVAEDLAARLGWAVTPIEVPLDQVVPTFTSAGMSDGTARLFRELYEAVAADRLTFEDPAAPHARGSLTPADALGPLLAQS